MSHGSGLLLGRVSLELCIVSKAALGDVYDAHNAARFG